MRKPSERWIAGGFALAMLLLGGVSIVSYRSVKTLLDNEQWVEHTEKVLDALDKTLDEIRDAENERNYYLLRGSRTVLDDYPTGIQEAEASIKAVRQLTADNPAQQRRLDTLEPLLMQRLMLLKRSFNLLQQSKSDAATQIAISQEARILQQEIRTKLAEMTQEERRLLQTRSATAEASVRYTFLAFSLGYGLSFSILFSIFFLLKKQIRERQQAQTALEQLNEQLENRVQERTAELTATNALLRSEVIERKQTEQALQQSREELESRVQERTEALQRSNEELEQFAYVASHDLQEPLRAVTSYTQMLARKYQGNLDEKADKYIGYVVDGATRMQQLINDLLAYSRVGRQELNLALTDCNSLVKQVLKNLQMAIPENGEVTVDPLPIVLLDPIQIGQLFQNLIGNGIKYCRDVPPRIHVSAVQQEQEWLFSICDNGIGIEPEYQEKIFIIFRRLHTRREYPGTGIGLAICKKIVEHHKGHIWVESQLGEGATFYFTLPIALEETSPLSDEQPGIKGVEN